MPRPKPTSKLHPVTVRVDSERYKRVVELAEIKCMNLTRRLQNFNNEFLEKLEKELA